MKKLLSMFMALAVMAFAVSPVFAVKGFNEFGYNYNARIFSGLADGVDKTLNGMVWGDPTYANDRLVMKWNAAWDACNTAGGNDVNACLGAWTNNEWNGAVPNGSGEVWHYKMIWVGPLGEDSPYWAKGGYSIWGNYEVIMDQGTADGVHTWFAHGISTGYGAN